ncbi:hypothetical protein QTN47_27365 [Danxiaibacter flavus]|uniref:Uncharacterized protein n=1 Tax=Danxiaibacter flavus TaxID=3049108 RepID=A0ABV3ZPQ4_9BACT|nr:hypothetical protein QNM32_27365 [Chitinophagaceae bacterium DXS]
MATNIIAGPNSVVALDTADNVSMSALGLTESNCVAVYRTLGSYRSWVPGRPVNSFDKLEKGVGYIIIAKEPLDLSQWFAPPVPLGGGTGGDTPTIDYNWLDDSDENI